MRRVVVLVYAVSGVTESYGALGTLAMKRPVAVVGSSTFYAETYGVNGCGRSVRLQTSA